MKVFELMSKLSTMPAGLEVRISMVKELSELPVFEDKMRSIDFIVHEVTENGNHVDIDGWAE